MQPHRPSPILTVGLIIAVIAGIGLSVWRLQIRQSTAPGRYTSMATPSPKVDELVLHNLGGAEFLPARTDGSGSITFSRYTISPSRGFITPVIFFGYPLPKNSASEPQRINPNIEFTSLSGPIPLISALDGEVVFIREQAESNDSEVFIQPYEGSKWMVAYDHVTDVSVSKGQQVRVGEVIGKAAQRGGSGYGYELQVNEELGGSNSIHHCPTTFLSSEKALEIGMAAKSFRESWNEWYGSAAYPDSTDVCAVETLTPAQAEGR